jgi:tape measure domain-containing protein
MTGPISSFYAQVGINTRIQDLRKVDRYLKHVETKLKRFEKLFSKNFSLGISSFFVNERSLKRTLGNALDKASKDVVFEVSRFAVNERNLRAAMLRAGRSFAREAVPYQSSLHRANTTVTRHERPQLADRSGRNFMYGGGTAGALARYGFGSVPFIGGAYGLMTLNRGSQELQANAMALSASAGNEADTKQYTEFLNNLGDRLGKKTSTMTPFFAQMLAGSKGTALEPHLMTGFESLMEYSSVMMLDDQKIKGTIRAFTQMIGKQQIMAEELRGQAAEHLPPIVRLMADVAAGGDTKKLNKMMEMGQLDPNVHLPLLYARLKEEAEPMLPKYFKTSVFAQGFMGKKFEDLLKTFGEKGGDEGFARFFKMVGDAASKLTPVVEGLAKAFNWLTKQLEMPIGVLGDLGMYFENTKKAVEGLTEAMNEIHPAASTFAGLGLLIMSKWGRLGLIFQGMFMLLEDISAAMGGGKKSVTGDLFKFLEKFVEFDRGIMGVAMAFLTVAAAIKLASKVLGASLLYDFLKKQSGFPGDMPGTPDKSIPGKGKPTSPGAGWMRMLSGAGLMMMRGGPLLALASYWGMNQEDFKLRYNQDYDFREESSVILERLFGGGLGAIGRTLGTGGNIPWHQRDEYLSGLGRQWESPSDFLDFKKQQALYGEGNGQSDIPSVPNTPEQAIAQMGMMGNTSNTITNTFEIKIDGVIDPTNMENIFNQEILPQIEGWWTNQLGEVDISYGSK